MTESTDKNVDAATKPGRVALLLLAGLLLDAGEMLLLYGNVTMGNECSAHALRCGGGLLFVLAGAFVAYLGFTNVRIAIKDGHLSRKQAFGFVTIVWIGAWIGFRHLMG